MALGSGGQTKMVRSRDKLKSSYLHYYSAYGHQNKQDGNLSWWVPAYKVTWPVDHMVTWDRMTNKTLCISTIRVPMDTKLGSMVT